MATKVREKMTLEKALCQDAYQWLGQQAPMLLVAIDNELADGVSPEQVRWTVSQNVGPERQALAQRCYLAARWLTEYAEAA